MAGTLKPKGDSRMIKLAAPERREGQRSEPVRNGRAATRGGPRRTRTAFGSTRPSPTRRTEARLSNLCEQVSQSR
jgi:hypothetical protein